LGRRPIKEESNLRRTIRGLLPADGQPIRWKELTTRAKQKELSQSTLSIYLKKFIADGSVKREVNEHAYPPSVVYRLTDAGKTQQLRDPIVKRIQQSARIIQGEFQVKVGEDTFERGTGVLAPRFFLREHETWVDLLVDKDHAAIADDLMRELPVKQIAKDFANEAYHATYRVLRKGKGQSSTWKEELEYDRQALNTDVTIMIRFNGKKIAAAQDWDEQLRKAEHISAEREKELSALRDLAVRDRKAILEAMIAHEIRTQQGSFPTEEILNSVVENWATGELPDPPTSEEVAEIVDEWVKAGLVELETLELWRATDELLASKAPGLLGGTLRTIYAKKRGWLPPID
jgi:hypothetical protein